MIMEPDGAKPVLHGPVIFSSGVCVAYLTLQRDGALHGLHYLISNKLNLQ